MLLHLLSASHILELEELLKNEFSQFIVIPELDCHSGFHWREKIQSEAFRDLLDIWSGLGV